MPLHSITLCLKKVLLNFVPRHATWYPRYTTHAQKHKPHGFRTFNRVENRKEISVCNNLMLMVLNNSLVAIHITTQLIYDGNSRDFRGFSETTNISYIVLDGKLYKASGHSYYLIKITNICNHAANYTQMWEKFACYNCKQQKWSNMLCTAVLRSKVNEKLTWIVFCHLEFEITNLRWIEIGAKVVAFSRVVQTRWSENTLKYWH